MKKFLILSILLLLLITAGCVTTKKTDLVLPPKPQREIMPEIKTTKDFANVINYYEHLVQEWEKWGDDVEKMVGQ